MLQSYCNGDENFDATVIYLRPVAFDWELGNEKGTAFCPWYARFLLCFPLPPNAIRLTPLR